MATIATLQRIPATKLSEMILAEKEASDPTFAVVDVRDDDYIGGHIKGSMHFASSTLPSTMPGLVRRLREKKTVVFHCVMSQHRGPHAALRYIREREAMMAKERKARAQQSSGESADGEEGQVGEEPDVQKVVVLDRGFGGWQEVYGADERLTEGYRKELWENGYS